VQAFKAPKAGRVEYQDDGCPGLRLRIGSSGTKTFIVRKRTGDKVVNVTIGRYGPRLGLAEARKRARALLSDLEAGKGVPKPKTREGSSGTIRALIPPYLASKVNLRSHAEIKRVLERYVLPELGDRMADTITRQDVTELVDEIAETAPVMARAVHAQLSAFYKWALPRLRMEGNPCRDAGRPSKPKARARVLAEDELRALWSVSNGEALPFGPGIKLLILTGQRRDEVFSADRAEFDMVAKVWTIPAERAKNGLAHIVPLSAATLAVLATIPEIEGSPKLFPTRTKAGQAERGPSGFSKAVARIRLAVDEELEREGGEHWTLHDIRRTVATGLQRVGVRFEVTEAVLNHVSGSKGGIAGVYQHHDWKEEKRVALDLWAAELDRIVTGKAAGANVVKLKGAR
jgi:integrase